VTCRHLRPGADRRAGRHRLDAGTDLAPGPGRSYQKTNIFLPFSVWDNVFLAAQSRDPQQPWNPLRWMRSAAGSAARAGVAARRSRLAGLQQRRDAIAANISHGEQRQLEIAMTLATEPQVLLLDEPLAGMGVAEAERMVALLLRIKKDHAILLVEHDMDAVFTLADALTVMVNGQVIATGTPAQIRGRRQCAGGLPGRGALNGAKY
jgi:branched-chain amino acid transport system ATP-binding protein